MGILGRNAHYGIPGVESVPEGTHFVVVNDEGQHAIWPAALAVPAGWRRQGRRMSKERCLSVITARWPDIAPRAQARNARPVPARGHDPRPVHELFDERATGQPGATAVVSAGAELTYRQLGESANQLARYLQGRGARQEMLIGVCLERGAEAIRCLLAVLKAGAAYVPLDPSLPAVRLAEMREEADIGIILTRRDHAGAFSGSGAELIFVDELPPGALALPVTAPAVSLCAENIAYAIYTSGSTGRPKAVAVSHHSLACFCQEIIREYGLTRHDRVGQLAPLAVDTSLEQIFAALLAGAALMLPGPGAVAPTDLVRYLAEQRVSVIDLTPAYWHEVIAAADAADGYLGPLRLMITGGDLADARDCRAALSRAHGARLVNAYGLTEATITSTLCEITHEVAAAGPAVPVPVGKPLPHVQVFVLDDSLQPAAPGAVGEVYLGGCGIARGYLGRPGLTAERFLPNPYSDVPGARMYRTGDLGRWRPDQNLEVIGRADQQIKVGGFRVEPAEAEVVLSSHPDIGQAVVVARDDGGTGAHRPGDRYLVAYYTLRAPVAATPSPGSLRRFLAARLPGFMIPAQFVAMERLPLTREGKPDRAALRGPASPPGDHPGTPVWGPWQAAMSHLWAEILKAGQVRPDDDFFAVGGSSILAAELLARTRVLFGIAPDQMRALTRCLLRDPTLRSFAKAAQHARAGVLAGEAAAGAEAVAGFAREAEPNVPIRRDAARPARWQQPASILLTGATGFFGVHLLREFLASTGAQVRCLVRADSASHGLRRIASAAERCELGELPLDRVVPVPGDLSQPWLGLDRATFTGLAATTDVIHHAGALVNFIYPYSALRAVNVGGTRELIRLAGDQRGIPVHFVSTTAVLAGFAGAGIREVTEETPLAHAGYLSVGYIETKFVAEEMLRSAARQGLPAAIYRPFDIVGDQRTGAWNTATEMCALIRFITDTGIAPDIDLPLDFVPADVCAAAVNYIASHADAAGQTYHLASPKYALLGSLTDRLRAHGFAVREVSHDQWVDELLRYAAAHPAHPMAPFVPLFVDRSGPTSMTVAEMYFEKTFPSYTRENTERALRGSGIVFPAVSDALLDVHIKHLMASGYLNNPGAGRAVPRRRD